MLVWSLTMWWVGEWEGRRPVSWGLSLVLPCTLQIPGVGHTPNNLSQHPYSYQYIPIVNVRLLALGINFYFSLNCYKALPFCLFVKTQRPTSDYILLFQSSPVSVGTKNAKGITHVLSQESNFGHDSLHKWIRQLGASGHGFNAPGEIMFRDFVCVCTWFSPWSTLFLVPWKSFSYPLFSINDFFLYAKCEPDKAQYQQDFELSTHSSCCGIRELSVISEKLATSILFSV